MKEKVSIAKWADRELGKRGNGNDGFWHCLFGCVLCALQTKEGGMGCVELQSLRTSSGDGVGVWLFVNKSDCIKERWSA